MRTERPRAGDDDLPSPAAASPTTVAPSAPAARLTSIQQFESPDDAAEAQLMADQRSAEPPTDTDGTAATPTGPATPASGPAAPTTAPAAVKRVPGERPTADRAPERLRPAVPAGDDPAAARAATDIQTTSGVPATPIAAPGPDATDLTQVIRTPPPGEARQAIPLAPARTDPPGETTRRIETPPVVPGPVTRPAGDAETPTVEFRAVPAAPAVPTAPALPAPEQRAAPAAGPARRRVDLGSAPAVLALSSFGVLLVALAYADGRDGTTGALPVYWIGQLIVFTPVVVRLLSRRLTGVGESFLLVMGLAINQYFLKWMYSPDQFRFPDELQHWLATTLIVQTGDLFRPNPALPPAVHFPGLAEMGAGVSALTGLPVTAAGLLVAGVAHLLFVGALYAAILRASSSPAIAGVACVVYATSLHYLFFNSMYLYATGALPFLMLAVWATRRWRTGGGWPFAVTAVTAMVATTVTHHVTSFMMVGTLALLGLAELLTGGRGRRWSALLMPVVGLMIVSGWIGLVARDVIGYLQAPVDQIAQTIAVLTGGAPAPAEGPAAVADPVPLWQLAIQGAGLLALFALYLAVARDMLQRRDRDPWRWAALAGGAVFFAGNGVRFLGSTGPEIAGRLTTFTYVPISILAAIALVQAIRIVPRRNADGRWLRGGPPPLPAPTTRRLAVRIAAGSIAVTLLMIGARVGGWPPTASLLPGPYMVSAFERSVDEAGVEAADWQRDTLGPGHRVGGDVTAVFLSATYGRQDPVREVGPLYYAPRWTADNDAMVRSLGLEYLVVDRRLTTDLPESGQYFEQDPLDGRHTTPIDEQQLTKFDDVPGVDRLYDNGDIHIYRMGDR